MGDNQEPAQTLHQLFFKTESDGYGGIKFTNTLNLGENEINNRIRQDLRNQINNMLLQRISTRDEINRLTQLMHEAQKLGLTKNNDNAIKKVQQIITLIDNVEYRLTICRSFWSSGFRRICAKIGLMLDCMQGLSNALQECREYGIFKTLGKTEDMHEDMDDFVLTPLNAAEKYYYQRENEARACMEAQAATQATHNKTPSDISSQLTRGRSNVGTTLPDGHVIQATDASLARDFEPRQSPNPNSAKGGGIYRKKNRRSLKTNAPILTKKGYLDMRYNSNYKYM